MPKPATGPVRTGDLRALTRQVPRDEATMADGYMTGHKPQKTIQQLVSEANAGAFFVKDHAPKERRKRGSRRVDRITAQIEALSQEQLEMLMQVLSGKAIQLQVKGEPYLAWRANDGWAIRAQRDGSAEHFVDLEQMECSCPRSSKLGERCKHLEALEVLK